MASLKEFVTAFEALLLDDSHGYSQVNRWGEYGDYDCSSAIIYALRSSGFDVTGATYTGNMREALCARGFIWLAPDVAKERGDILLNEACHVAVYLGNDTLGEFSCDENGGINGVPGDQNGREGIIHSYYNYPWDGILRLSGATSTPKRSKDMICIIQPNGESRLIFFDGQKIHNLNHPDQVEAIAMVYREINGCEIPSFVMGSRDAPWFTRLEEAINA